MKLVVLISMLVLSACGQKPMGDINTTLPVGSTPALIAPNASGITSDTQCGLDFITQNDQTFIITLGSQPVISQPLADNAYFVGNGQQFCKYIIYQGLLEPVGETPNN